MKKLLLLTFLSITSNFGLPDLVARPSQSSPDYDRGYGDGYQFAIDHCVAAAQAHPEWDFALIPRTYYYYNGSYDSWFAQDDDGTAPMLAVNYTNVSYYSGIYNDRTLNDYYQGYHDGYVQATADFVIGM